MSKRTTGMLKGIGIGLLLCLAVMQTMKMVTSMNSPKNRRKRHRLQQDAGRCVHMIGDVIDDVGGMFAKR